MTWAAVAAGRADARNDRLARYIDSTFPYKFFLAIWHEPENDVVATAGSGMTAADYAAMYRHVVLRLRADGVTNAVTVMNYMGFDNWAVQPWFNQLWPGDDVVDWIGIDPYGTGAASGWTARDLATLVNRPQGSFPGFYTWALTRHPGKPMMLAEWGVEYVGTNPAGQAHLLADMAQALPSFPNIRALVYFDMPQLSRPSYVTSPAVNATALAAYRRLANSPAVATPAFRYPAAPASS
jgi:beta-mannanase